MNEDEVARGLAGLRDLLRESGFGWIDREPSREAGDETLPPRSPRAQLLHLLQELRTVLVDAPAMTARLLEEIRAERVVFKVDPVESPEGDAASEDVTFVDRADVERRMGIALEADQLIARMSDLARG